MPVSRQYQEYLQDLLAWVPGLHSRRMFGGVAFYSEGGVFAIAADDTLYLKTDDGNRDLYRDGGGEQFTYLRQGRPARMGYWSVPADVLEASEVLERWVRAALQGGA